MNYTENNKRFAQFMGFKLQDNPDERWFGNWFTTPNNAWGNRIEVLQFHKDWDWLMKVINKISQVCQDEDLTHDFELWMFITDEIGAAYDIASNWIEAYEQKGDAPAPLPQQFKTGDTVTHSIYGVGEVKEFVSDKEVYVQFGNMEEIVDYDAEELTLSISKDRAELMQENLYSLNITFEDLYNEMSEFEQDVIDNMSDTELKNFIDEHRKSIKNGFESGTQWAEVAGIVISNLGFPEMPDTNLPEQYFVNGYYIDDKREFHSYIVQCSLDVNEKDDENIFYYCKSFQELKEMVGNETAANDFVITEIVGRVMNDD